MSSATHSKNKGLDAQSFDMIRVKTYDCALMSGALPPFLDLAHVVRQDINLSGRLAVKSMPRLVSALTSDGDVAEIELQAARDLGGRVMISGSIHASLQMTCQRCLESAEIDVRAEPNLAWVKSDAEVETLPAEYDPLVSADGRVALAELVEDELLLALPLVPRHAEGACRETRMTAAPSASAPVEESRKTAFAELAKLKRGR